MSFVLAQPHSTISCHDLHEPSITSKLKGFFNGTKKHESKNIAQPLRPPARLPKWSRGSSDKVFQLSSSRRSSLSNEVPVSPARFSIQSEFRELRRTSIERILFPIRSQETSVVTVREGRQTVSARARALSILEIVEAIVLQIEDPVSLAVTTTKSDKSATIRTSEGSGPLSACLYVNRIFHAAAKRAISKRIVLHDMDQLVAYTQNKASQDNLCRDLLIHRVKACEQEQFEQIAQFRLRSLELYVCPKLIPTAAMLSSGTLLKIALPGCALVDDELMTTIARMCQKLQILDLRACEKVSDAGVIAIAQRCPDLSYLNVGRIKRSEAITDLSIVEICKRTSVETLGLAGCAISDESVLAVARHRGLQIERLSMNQCHKITDYALCELLRSSPRLQVLEVVGCDKLRDAKTMCFFKFSTGALVETSDSFAAEMQLYEGEVKFELERLKLRASCARLAARRVTA